MSWLWGLIMVTTQVYLGVSTAVGEANLLAFGIVLHIVLAVPFIVASYLGAWLAGRRIKSPI